jgi:hypothetical protein
MTVPYRLTAKSLCVYLRLSPVQYEAETALILLSDRYQKISCPIISLVVNKTSARA